MKIYHNSRLKDYREPFGATTVGSEVFLSVDIYETIPESVRLMVWKGETLSPTYYEMKECDACGGRFAVEFNVPDEACLLWYAFEIKVRNDSPEQTEEFSTIYYGNNQDRLGGEGAVYEYSPECYQITVCRKSSVPKWYTDGIVYQIFPDRFARDEKWEYRCRSANETINERRSDMKRTLQEDWNTPAYYERDEGGRVTEWPIYGGSLRGIAGKLDYLKSLGVSCIYLNPIFEATSNHRYDTADYMHIDPALGTDEDFVYLANAAMSKGIRLILDGVFSHTGADSIYFDKYGNYRSSSEAQGNDNTRTDCGAYSHEDSPYRSWYKFDDSKECGYKSWWGVDDLPEVNETDPGYREFITGEDGVVAHWLRMGASGWRLDVADELPDSFIRDIRKRMSEVASDSMLIGEVWEDASNKISYDESREYFSGDELGGVMNYPLRDVLLDYINYTITSEYAGEKLASLQENYPRENYYASLNLIGSHDRERIITAMAAEEDYESAVRKVKMLSAIQYTMPGVPCIYYGDEVGLTGGADPANRNAYPWGYENLDLGYHYRMLGLIYEEHPILIDGEFKMLSGRDGIGDDIFAFVRSGEGESIIVLANRSYGESYVDLSDIDEAKCGYAIELLKSRELALDENGTPGRIKMERLSVMIISLRDEPPARQGLKRSAGVICHVSSLPGTMLGKPAREFVDYIAESGFKIWQILPLNPPGIGNSPYSSHSAFAFDTRFINRDELPSDDGYVSFADKNEDWLSEYVAYTVTKECRGGSSWHEWPNELKLSNPREIISGFSPNQLQRANELTHDQYVFSVQWQELKDYANDKGISIMGDLPMFMASDSADVWANREVFRLEADGSLSVHAGVPPDAFTGEGQDWGNPLYDWDRQNGAVYDWWMRRIRQCAGMYDILRIDHFRGLSEYYAIPEGGNPSDGVWQHGPGLSLFNAMEKMLKNEGLNLKLIAEDLGYLDDGVKSLLRLSGLPGIDVWQFTSHEMTEMSAEQAACRAFYTGTHDNDTLMGFVNACSAGSKTAEAETDGGSPAAQEASDSEMRKEADSIIERIIRSPACLAMMQIQDVFLLGSEARMNIPGVAEGNWSWRIPGESVYDAFEDAAERSRWLRKIIRASGR